jgi:hypothetical protein
VGITVCNFRNPVSWVPQTFLENGGAYLWREKFEREPAYFVVADVSEEAVRGLRSDR